MELELETCELYELNTMLVARLERLSADSLWARRASGMRGSLLKLQERLEAIQEQAANPLSKEELNQAAELVAVSFKMLENAARELR